MADFDPNSFLSEETDSPKTESFNPDAFVGEEKKEVATETQKNNTPLLDTAKSIGRSILNMPNTIVDATRAAGQMAETFSNSAIEQVGGRAIIPAINARISSAVEGTDYSENYRFWQNQYDQQRNAEKERDPLANTAGVIAPYVAGGMAAGRVAAKIAGTTSFASASTIPQYLAANGKYMLASAIGDGLIASGLKAAQIGAGSSKGDLNDIAEAGLQNFVMSGVFSGVLKSAGAAFNVGEDAAYATYVKGTTSSLGRTANSGLRDYVQKFKDKGLDETSINKDTKAIFDELKLNDKEVVFNPSQLDSNVKKLTDSYGKAVGEAYDDLDYSLINPITGSPFQVSSRELMTELDAKMSKMFDADNLPVSNEKKEQILNAFRAQLVDPKTGEFTQKSLKDIWSIRKRFNDGSIIDGLDNNVEQQIGGTITDFLESNTSNAEKFVQRSLDSALETKANLKPARGAYGDAMETLSELGKQEASYADDIAKAQETLSKYESDLADAMQRAQQNGDEAFIKTANQDLEKARAAVKEETDALAKLMSTQEKLVKQIQMLSPKIKLADQVSSEASGAKSVLDNKGSVDFTRFKNAATKLKAANKKYDMLNTLNKNVLSKAKAPQTPAGFITGFVTDLIQRPMSTLVVGSVFGKNAATALVFGRAGFRAIKNELLEQSSKTADQIVFETSKKYAKMFDTFEKLDGDTQIARITANLFRSLNDNSISLEQKASEMEFASAEAELYLNPLPRTTEGVKARFNDIITYANKIAPQISVRLEKAMERQEYDKLGELMDMLSKSADIEPYIEPGQGWDGILYGADREMAAKNIMADRYLPTATKNALIDEVMTTGKVPNIEQFQRKPKVYSPRDKAKKRY